MFICKHCKIEFTNLSTANKANHSRWCKDNPKLAEYKKAKNCLQMQTPEAQEKRRAGIKQAWLDGKYDNTNHSHPGYKHSNETKAVLSQKALASTHRRLVRSIREYKKTDGTIVMLDSSWEEALAKRLDFLNITWIRPKAIKWLDKNNVQHNYFPDFYLLEYDLFLDPKNPYAIRAQQDKIDCLNEQIKNLVILKSLKECNEFTMPSWWNW